ncbi:MAG TPA: oligoribonuclease [Candidatus Saccharimonadales bacterium]|nr:oligoribonuclease [Candidatus Saccharimonadales bacterium]
MKKSNNYLVWIDLEMTGLDYNNDVILEIATIITDNDLNIIAHGPDLVIKQPDEILNAMNTWCIEQHGKTGLTQKVKDSTVTMQQAEEETLQFLETYCEKGSAPLCGNTVWFDKIFLKKEMPLIVDFLHYRVVDVTAFKIMLSRWAGKTIEFKKINAHRALDDIKESIEELKFYRTHFITIPQNFSPDSSVSTPDQS